MNSRDLGRRIGRSIKDTALVSSIPFVLMAQAGQIDDVTVTEHADLFADWGNQVSYPVREIVRYNNILYRCSQAHVSQADWAPDKTPALWAPIGDPGDEWPPWAPWIGSGDLYQIGDQVTYAEKRWVSTAANNHWVPGVYGWKEAS